MVSLPTDESPTVSETMNASHTKPSSFRAITHFFLVGLHGDRQKDNIRGFLLQNLNLGQIGPHILESVGDTEIIKIDIGKVSV
jgi:hypothetical protein